jgi:hypothetical protein
LAALQELEQVWGGCRTEIATLMVGLVVLIHVRGRWWRVISLGSV